MKHRISRAVGLLAGLFPHSVLHHFAIPVLAALGCGYPALGFPWFLMNHAGEDAPSHTDHSLNLFLPSGKIGEVD